MITLYHCNNSRSMRSLWLLYELKIKFKLVEMEFKQTELRSKKYLSIHPLGRVPCLIDDNITLYESGAICQYLCEKYDNNNVLSRSKGHSERHEWLQWLHYSETIAVHAASLVQQTVIISENERSPVVMKLEGLRLEKSLEVLNNHLENNTYMLRSGFSAVDTNIGYSVHLAKNFNNLSLLPNVKKYYMNISNRQAFKLSIRLTNNPLELS